MSERTLEELAQRHYSFVYWGTDEIMAELRSVKEGLQRRNNSDTEGLQVRVVALTKELLRRTKPGELFPQ